MRELGRHAMRPRPSGPAVLCNRTIVWRGERELTVLDEGPARVIGADWDLEHHELTPDGRYLLARGGDGRRVHVWDARGGQRIAIPARAALDDVEVLQTALREHPSVKEWGYRLAIGPTCPAKPMAPRPKTS